MKMMCRCGYTDESFGSLMDHIRLHSLDEAHSLSIERSSQGVAEVLDMAEYLRRRQRTEQGRSPAQNTPRSENKARRRKLPGKGQRGDWRHEEDES